jgi:hypothetical protein
MKRPPTISRRIGHVAWWCVVVSLLFSVGEGLQLTPFVAPDVSDSAQSVAGSNADTAFFAHGPIDIPVQFRKREKRDFIILDLPPSPAVEGLSFRRTPASSSNEQVFFQVLTFVTPGRAPPAVQQV